MTPRLRRLSSRQLLQEMRAIGFDVVNIEGSHAKLRRIKAGVPQIVTVPLHDALKAGTLVAIYRQLRRYAPEEEIRGIFYR